MIRVLAVVPPARLATVVLLLTVATACSSGGNAGSDATEPSAVPSSSASGPASGSPTSGALAASPTVPVGWTAGRQGDLVFALPPGFTARPEGSGMPGAAAQWTKTDDASLPIPPAVVVFVETGNLGPLGVRADLLKLSRKALLGVDPVGPAREVTVPGSTGAAQLQWSWPYAFQGKPPVPSRQVELLVQTGGPRQYGLLLGGPTPFMTDQVVADFVASVGVVPLQDGA